MGLINLLTDPKNFKFYVGGQGYTGNGNQPGLTNIPYGKDRIDGGNSGQPYIQTPIPDNVGNLGLANNDFILRGGVLSTQNAVTDALRLTKMFGDLKSPNGLLFIAKQQLLSRTAVRTQASGTGLNEGIYNPLTTIAQAGIVNIGGHLNKQSIIPYSETVKNNQLPDDNRLVQLYELSSIQQSNTINGITLNNGINILSYDGGPGSALGVGKTNIRYSLTSQTPLTNQLKTFNISNKSTGNNKYNVWVYDSKTLDEQSSALSTAPSLSPPIQDFRAVIRGRTVETPSSLGHSGAQTGQLAYAPSYNIADNQTLEGRTNLGDPGNRANKSYARYDLGVIDTSTNTPFYKPQTLEDNKKLGSFTPGLDKINSLPIYRSENVTSDNVKNDLVKFRIAIIDNNNPSFKTFMHFRAFLGSISDSYNANWNPVQYLGRGEQFFTYGGFTRQISLSWTVAAQSKQELIPMYKKLNYLASSLAPDYSPKGYMRGNLAQLTIGGYIYELPGIITGLTYDIQEDTPWEIGINSDINGGQDGTVKELSHIIRVTGFNFTPIHKFIPGLQELTFSNNNNTDSLSDDTGFVKERSYKVEGDRRFISIANGNNDKDSNYNYFDTNP